MPKGKSKKPHITKSREELLADLKSNAKFIEKMKFTKEQFYPAIVASSDSVDDAKMFLSSISNILMERFLAIMKEKKFKELNLAAALEPTDPHHPQYVSLLGLFDDMTVFDAKDLIEGMRNEIDLFINEEMKTRRVETLPVKWLDEL